MKTVTVCIQDRYAMPRLCCACGAPAGTQTLAASASTGSRRIYSVSLSFPLCDRCALANATVKRRRRIGCLVGLGLSILLGAAAFGGVGVMEAFDIAPDPLFSLAVASLVILAPLALLGGLISRWIVSQWPRELCHTYKPVSRAVRIKRYQVGFISKGRITFAFGNEQFADLFKQMNAGAIVTGWTAGEVIVWFLLVSMLLAFLAGGSYLLYSGIVLERLVLADTVLEKPVLIIFGSAMLVPSLLALLGLSIRTFMRAVSCKHSAPNQVQTHHLPEENFLLRGTEEAAMPEKQADGVRDTHGEEHDVSGPPVAGEPMVICPKCQAQNLPDRMTCSQCGAKLLPGRSVLERIGWLVAGVVLAAVFAGLAWLFTQMEDVPPCCASPLTLGLLALGGLVGGLRLAFSPTPEYEKYVKRAQRHVEAVPEQALADFTTALELAPEKNQAEILKQRGELYSKLGRKEEALADLSTYAASPQAHKGAKVVSEVIGVDMEEAAGALTEQPTIEALQRELVQKGALKGVGYCKHCKDAVELDENRCCSRCGGRVKEPRFVKPHEGAAELANIRKEATARRKRRLIWLTVGGVALFACALCVGWSVWSSRMQEGPERATATVAVPAALTTFAENIFSFEYPSNWDRITEEEIDTLLETSLKGLLRPGAYDYIGGVYTGGVGDCRGCAQIVIVVVKDPSLTGTLTDEQYEQGKEAAEDQMGSRLISYRKTEVSSMPAVESIHVGASRRTKLWNLIIVPPEPGVAYMFSCSSHKDSYADFEDVFERAIESLRIGELTPEATLTPEAAVEPTVDVSGCTLGAVFQADVTVPDNTRIEAGQGFTKTWRIRNTGTCDWGAGYRLTFIDGDQMGGPDSVDVPETVGGESVEVSVGLVAPVEAGQYWGNWQMCVNRSEYFGDSVYLQIISFGPSTP